MCDISIIIPVHDGETWIDDCMNSVTTQTILSNNVTLEIVVYNDGSTDRTKTVLESWIKRFEQLGVELVITGSSNCKGVGAAKNGAISESRGKYLCFQDIDDRMLPNRILLQWEYARKHENTLVGACVQRSPINSTPRFINWANSLTPDQLKVQIYTSNGPTLLMPTWFCHRSVYDKVGKFDESGKGTPEDLIFFYNHLDLGGDLFRINEELVIYTYHMNAATFSVSRKTIWQIQLDRLEKNVLTKWESFTIWNAGKLGRKIARALNKDNLNKLTSFCDVDNKKIGRAIELYCPLKRKVLKKVPVVHFVNTKPPLLICVKLNLTEGQFESNLKSLNLKEGTDYILFN